MRERLNRKSVVVIGLVTGLICLFALTYPAGSASIPSEVLSPVVGDLEVVSSLEQCSGAKWCFNQYKSGGHAPGGGICQADDTYAWDTNLNSPEFDWDKGKPVYAVEQGVVAQKYGGDCINAGGSYGQLLIEHKYQGNTWWSGYLHLKDIQVSLGQSVDKNTLLGYISNTSLESIPNHLHFVVYKGENSRGKLVSFNANIVTRSFSPKFNSGNDVQTTAKLHLRTAPEIDDNIITTIPSGSTGQIVEHEDNGIFADGYCWWHAQFGSDNGWCVEDWLEKIEPPTTNPVFTVVGTVENADDTLAADGLEVVVSNETKKLTATTILGEQESGRYGVAFVDTENKTVAAEGDSLKVTVKSEGDILGSQIYKLTFEDIVKARAIVDITLLPLAIGGNVKVTNTADAGLRIHKDAPTGETVKVIPDGWVFKITGGPQYNIEGHNWWEIQEEKYEPSPIKGWVAEDFLEKAASDGLVPDSPPNYFVSAQERVEEAIKWAKGKEGSSDWKDLCLKFVSQAYGLGESVNAETTKWTCPNDAIEKLGDKFYKASDYWNPPRGALVFFSGTGDYEPYGHIGIYLGDVEAIHAYGTVRIQSLTGSEGIEQLSFIGSYLGWAYPPEEWFSPLERVRPAQAAQLAKTVLGAPYVARKGYEYIWPHYYFDEPEEITQKGLDCSGLNFWSYNRAYFADEGLTPEEFENRPLYYFGANEQYRGNIEDERPAREELSPGDLLFFDVYADSHKGWKEGYREIGQDGHIDHVAMYVGTFTYEEKEYDVVHATLSAGKVTVDTVDGLIENLENLAGKGAFVSFGRVKDAKKPEFKVIAASPVNLIVTDPDGEMITKEMGESVTMEYMVYDINGDGKLDDIVASPERKTGNYQITVAPEPDVSPTDAYSLEVTFIKDEEATTFIATNIPITTGAIHQYTIDWVTLSQGEKGVTVQMDSDGDGTFEETINTGATFTAEKEHPWDVNSDGIVDISDLVIVGQHFGESPPSAPRADVNGDGTVDISDLVLVGQHFGE
ncbi:hypothetical protein FJZ31_32660 [Candidatus Poribacteria bacterium]|nr:hypothetical protein [Candidatus Poribacteria bacterium]